MKVKRKIKLEEQLAQGAVESNLKKDINGDEIMESEQHQSPTKSRKREDVSLTLVCQPLANLLQNQSGTNFKSEIMASITSLPMKSSQYLIER